MGFTWALETHLSYTVASLGLRNSPLLKRRLPMHVERPLRQRETSTLQCKAVLRRASRGLQRAAGLRLCAHAIAPLRCFLSAEGAARALAACARLAALVGVGSCPTEAYCASETALSLIARPCSDEPAMASNEKSACARAHTRSRHYACSLSGEGAARALTAWARHAALVGVGPCPSEAHCTSETTLSLIARPRSGVPSTASNEQPACARADMRKRHCAIAPSGGGEARALVARARRAALVVVGLCPWKGHCASARPLPFGARPCSNVPAAASNEQPACACAHTQSRHCSASSRDEAQHARLRRARAVLRWLASVQVLWKLTAPARRPSESVHGGASTCQPRPPMSGRRLHERTREFSTARSLSEQGAARACGTRTPRRADWSRIVPFGRPLHQQEAILGTIPCSDVPVAATNEQATCACAHTGSRHCAHPLSRGGAAHARAA